MTLRMSADGRRALIAREGRELTAYRDTKGILTIGVGHTSAAGAPQVTAGLKISEAECDAILARDLGQFEDVVNAVGAQLSQKSFDALVSLAFNIGAPAFTGSTVAKQLRAGDLQGAASAILLWNKPPEIRKRRRGEYDQFRAGLADEPAGPTYPVLQIGDSGADVIELQRQLKAAGIYTGQNDGDFGPKTRAAVEILQRRAGLKIDGIAGPRTRSALSDRL